MSRFRALLTVAAVACLAAPLAAQVEGEYEMLTYGGDTLPTSGGPPTLESGILVIRRDSGFVLRLTHAGRDRNGQRVLVRRRFWGVRTAVDGEPLLRTAQGSPEYTAFFIPPGPDGILRVRDNRPHTEFRRVQSEPWKDGSYRAVRWEGMPLPAVQSTSERLEWVGRTLELSGGRYRSRTWYLTGTRTAPDSSIGTGSYTVEGRELVMRTEEPQGPGRTVRMHWSRKPDGTLRIIYRDGESWEYRLEGAAPSLAPAAAAPAPRADALPDAGVTVLRPGQTVAGALEPSDPRAGSGEHYDRYVIRGTPGSQVVVRMRSRAIDPLLSWGRVAGGEWRESRSDNDGALYPNARLVVTLPAEGGYELRATAFRYPQADTAGARPQAGAYELQVAAFSRPRPRPLALGATVRGELTRSDFTDIRGPEDHYVFTGRMGRPVTFLLGSDTFDPYVAIGTWYDGTFHERPFDLGGPAGEPAAVVADMLAGDEVHLVVRAASFVGDRPLMGTYTLRVEEGVVDPAEETRRNRMRSADPNVPQDEGTYELSTPQDFSGQGREGGVPRAPAPTTGTFAGRVRAGEEIPGELPPGAGSQTHYRDYRYQGVRGEALEIAVASTEFDAHVSIGRGTGAGFLALAANDDGATRDPKLEYALPGDDAYTIRVTSASPDGAGRYVLKVRSSRPGRP